MSASRIGGKAIFLKARTKGVSPRVKRPYEIHRLPLYVDNGGSQPLSTTFRVDAVCGRGIKLFIEFLIFWYNIVYPFSQM